MIIIMNPPFYVVSNSISSSRSSSSRCYRTTPNVIAMTIHNNQQIHQRNIEVRRKRFRNSYNSIMKHCGHSRMLSLSSLLFSPSKDNRNILLPVTTIIQYMFCILFVVVMMTSDTNRAAAQAPISLTTTNVISTQTTDLIFQQTVDRTMTKTRYHNTDTMDGMINHADINYRSNHTKPTPSVIQKKRVVPITNNKTTNATTGSSIPFASLGTDRFLQQGISRRINCGGRNYIDVQGNRWNEDTVFAKGGQTYQQSVTTTGIANTVDDTLYETMRYGKFSYSIPVPNGDYEVFLFFAEVYFTKPNERVFSITIQNQMVFNNVDIIKMGKNKGYVAVQLESVIKVTNQVIDIGFQSIKQHPFVSAIQVEYIKPHVAHAVSNGPYYGVDTTNTNKGTIRVDGSLSHTHGIGSYLTRYIWKLGSKTISTSASGLIQLPVGEHAVSLIVIDNSGDTDIETTTMTIFPYGYPSISSVYPDTGNIKGGTIVTITGSGFVTSDQSLHIRFGRISVDRRQVTIIGNSKMEVVIPPSSVKVPVDVVVETSKGISNGIKFTYTDGSPIAFTSNQLQNFRIGLPTVLTFDNNSMLYVGTADGKIARLHLSDDFTTVTGSVVSNMLRGRTILGIAADPMNAPNRPAIYVSHSTLFHGESQSTSGLAINGKVSRIEGANMDVVVDIITNLPVSDHDHSVNGLEFGDNGELYIQVGGNTNAGVPGRLTGSRIQKENPLSGATLVADLADPNFDGNIQYDALDDGNVISKNGVRVFAPGQRNSFDITLHSNGNLYATDNGPNNGYGKRSTGCGRLQESIDPDEMDKLNLILEKRYYGHPNRHRGTRDRRQCVWRSITTPSNADYKGPMISLKSSTNGIIEFQTNHFEGQLRHDLIVSKYKDGLYRIILSDDGKNVSPESNPPIPLVGDNTLSVTQAPDGTLIDTRYLTNQIYVHQPVQVTPMPDLLVYGVYPRRGGQAGGYILSIYGFNLQQGAPLVMVGPRRCPILTVKPKRITCRVFGGTGTVDVFVKIGVQKVTLKRGFRYIRGF